MDLRRALPWHRHIGAIKHRLIGRHIVIDDLEDDAEFADNGLTLTFLASEEGQVLTNTHALSIRELVHHLTQLDDAVTKKARTPICLVALVCHDEGCELKLRVFRHLILSDGQVESVGRENRVLDGRRDIGPAFLTFATELQSHKIVELLCKLEVL